MIEAHQIIKLHWLRASRFNPRKELRPTHALHVLISEPDSHLWPLGCTRFRRQDMAHAQERIGGVMSSAVANAEPRIRCRITDFSFFMGGQEFLHANFLGTFGKKDVNFTRLNFWTAIWLRKVKNLKQERYDGDDSMNLCWGATGCPECVSKLTQGLQQVLVICRHTHGDSETHKGTKWS